MEAQTTKIPGCLVLLPRVQADERGFFVKTFQASAFAKLGLETDFREEYHSLSRKDVVRGLHFQVPPHDLAKVVYCATGAVMDVVVDLRRGSPAFGQHLVVALDAEGGKMVYVPRGCAHGFRTLSETVLMMYRVTAEYSPSHDAGIRWDSVGIDWGVERPILSARDRGFVPLSAFSSPFDYREGRG